MSSSSRMASRLVRVPVLVSLWLDVILIVGASPPLHTRTGDEFLSKQEDLSAPASGSVKGFQSKSNSPSPPVAEIQLEQLKKIPNITTTDGKPQAPSKGTLNLETPAVSDNSQPQPEGPGTIDYDKVTTLSKVESDKRSILESPEKSSTSLKIEMDYTPQDIAEYIFWTGDEPGVVSALNDFLQDELVDKEDVIKFLEDVKVELKLLKSRYSSGVTGKPEGLQQPENLKFKGPPRILTGATSFPTTEAGLGIREKRIVQSSQAEEERVENEELVQTMNRMNMKLREDSLEEIIYRLAKELFLGGSGQHSIQKFAHFVEEAGASGHFPKDLEKHVLDILVSALVDSVNQNDNQYQIRRPSKIESSFNVQPSQNIMKH